MKALHHIFPLSNCSLHSPKSHGYHLRHFSGGFPSRCKPITCPLPKTEVCFIGFCQRDYSCLLSRRTVAVLTPVKLNATIATILFFFKFVIRKLVANCLQQIYILPECDKLSDRVVYIIYILLKI